MEKILTTNTQDKGGDVTKRTAKSEALKTKFEAKQNPSTPGNRTGVSGGYSRSMGQRRFRSDRPNMQRGRREEEEFDVRIVSIRRVTKVKAGGKTMRLSVMVVVGDKKGRVGVAIAKGKDVKSAQMKAINRAKKTFAKIPMKGQTIPHNITFKFGAARVFLKPAVPGTGVIAGSAVRSVVELVGIKDILSKVLGTKNTIANVYATFEALKRLRLSRFDVNGTK